MLTTLQQLRAQLIADPTVTADEKMKRRSAYNFCYGVSLYYFLRYHNLLSITDGPRTSNIDRVHFALEQLENNYKDLYATDLPDYDLDDYTLLFDPELLVSIAKQLSKLDYNIPYEDFWQTHESFFISSF